MSQASHGQSVTWNGDLSSAWDVTTANWAGGALFSNGNRVTFNDSASGTTTVVVDAAGVTLASSGGTQITVDNNTKNYDISGGVISGTVSSQSSLIKSGTGVLTLSGSTANTFANSSATLATVLVNDGTLVLNKTAGVNAFGVNASTDATTLRVGDGTGLAGSAIVRLAQSDQIPNAANVSVNGDGLFDLNGKNETISSLSFTGVGGQVSTGAGLLTMSAQWLSVGANSSASISGRYAQSQGVNSGQFVSGTLTMSALYEGAGRIFNRSPGTIILENANNSHTGGVQLGGNGATLIVRNNALSAAGAGNNSVLGTMTGNVSGTPLNRVYFLWGSTGPSSTADNGSQTFTIDGAYTINRNFEIARPGSGTITMNGMNTGAGATYGGQIDIVRHDLTVGAVGASDKVTFSGVITDGVNARNVVKSGLGTVVFSGNNAYDGATTIGSGILQFASLASGTNVQPLGGGTLVNLGVAATSAGELDYAGAGGTLDKNITALGSGRNRIRNSGAGTLTLSGTLTKNGTILELAGGTFNVSGPITGASANSDLFVNGATVTLSNTNNDYNGPTYVYGGGTLNLGGSNVIPAASAVILGGTGSDTGTGTLNLQTHTDAVASLTFGAGGGTVRMAANQTASPQLSTSAALALGSGASLNLTGMQTSAGNYRLISASSLTGTFGSVTGLDSNYLLRYGTVNANEISAQRKAEFGTITATPAAATIITGGSTAFGYTVANLAPTEGSTLSFTSANGSNVAGSSSGSAGANATSSSISGLVFTGTSVGLGQTGSFTLTDPDAIGSPANGTVTVNVLNHSLASFASSDTATKTLDFGSYDAGSWSGGDGGNGTLAYSLFNIASLGFTNAETAGLNFYGWEFASGQDVFSVGFSSFANLASGSSSNLFATVLSPGSLAEGSYSGVYTLKFRDQQDLSGAANTRNLSLTMNVVVVPEPGAIALAGIGIAAAYALRRRRCL